MSLLRLALCAGALVAAAWWAFALPLRALPPASLPTPQPAALGSSDDPAASSAQHASLDLAAFRAPLWVAPPAAPVPPVVSAPPKPAPEPSAPPFKWQLLAIAGSNASAPNTPRSAVIYDPVTDTVFELAAGQQHEGRTVESVSDRLIVVRQGKHTYALSLDEPGAARGALRESGGDDAPATGSGEAGVAVGASGTGGGG